MNLFDSHCHFESPSEEEIKPILERAFAAGVGAVMAIGCTPELNRAALAARKIAGENPGACPRCFAATGFDRSAADGTRFSAADFMEADCIGEIGLDYYYSDDTKRRQRDIFSRQLEIASSLSKPVSIHTRCADEDTLAILGEIPSRGIIHCFTGERAFCSKLLDMGFYISFSGIVTFRMADNVRDAAKFVPPDRMLVETDSPYLAPVPMRGKRNEPAFVGHTVSFLAEMLSIPVEELSRITWQNAMEVLG